MSCVESCAAKTLLPVDGENHTGPPHVDNGTGGGEGMQADGTAGVCVCFYRYHVAMELTPTVGLPHCTGGVCTQPTDLLCKGVEETRMCSHARRSHTLTFSPGSKVTTGSSGRLMLLRAKAALSRHFRRPPQAGLRCLWACQCANSPG